MSRRHDTDLHQLPDPDGRYMLINILARRARSLNNQRTSPQSDDAAMFDPIEVARSEYRAGRLNFKIRQPGSTEAVVDFRSQEP
jgi:DNA-directed RNA polymerase subunit K/omega